VTARQSAWTGWVVFAAAMIGVLGVLSMIAGLAAVLRDEAYFLHGNQLLILDLTAWGWIHIVLGIALLAVGAALYRGSTFARVVAIGVVGLNLLAQFTWLDAAPAWSLIMIAIDIVVLYAIIVHGSELRDI